MGLRLAEGIELKRLEHRIDEKRIFALESEGLLTRDGDRLTATPQGRLVLDRLILELAA
jgi:oxygen-independent coproporphyrinogen-3 oxidase